MGNVDKAMLTDRTDEIGLLIKSFERMRTSLKVSLSMIGKKETTSQRGKNAK